MHRSFLIFDFTTGINIASRWLFARSIDSVKFILAEPDRCTNHVLIKMLHPGSARDRQHRARAFEEPGERNLTGLGIVPLCRSEERRVGKEWRWRGAAED